MILADNLLNSVKQIQLAAQKGNLIVVVGSGISMNLTRGTIPALSWKGLVEDGFSYALIKNQITKVQNEVWKGQLSSIDIDDLLAAAEFVGKKLGAPDGDLYARWLERVFKEVVPTNEEMCSALCLLRDVGVRFCTLNYDTLLEKITGLQGISINEPLKVSEWVRGNNSFVLHLHGIWNDPASCVLGVRDYEKTLGNDFRDLIQRSIGSFNQMLFIGCGETFSDPNFSSLTKWLREKMKSAALLQYALVRASEVSLRNADPSWHGFVEPVSYGADHNDLPSFLKAVFGSTKIKSVKKTASTAERRARNGTTLESYRSFLLRDCGQITIEGVSSDMSATQGRFDLERLFVPLKVLQCPPDLPMSDPDRGAKLEQWQKDNSTPLDFGEVFASNRRLVLLALPGGGKTLLLKRIAVAYSDINRRNKSDDHLPDLTTTPIMIRCREWRDYIRRPIISILKSMGEITGQSSLSGLNSALLPLLKKGDVLLLVDGLDEIHNDADRATFVDNLESFIREYENIRVVITSREAGFALVAPSLARVCNLWRIAPLSEDAIKQLCGYWHRLMSGDSPEASLDSESVADHLLQNVSLRRLAENPLLLTMLLVVKHGAGRLPPDRVSLYERAVEVLLDTWNIKGHDPLNLKEAVPQLACVAYHLLQQGKQTATKKELLSLLEEARDKVPQIRRYAIDTPDQFLKRVEVRSSLLLEGGHQLERGRPVPFYQFRHLTFQEYLAAVAAAEGHYMSYQKGDTVLSPLKEFLQTEEWKEVIPMAAVIARKQAEPLIDALVKEGNRQRNQAIEADTLEDFTIGDTPPPPVARLLQCLAEETEAEPETLTSALELVAFCARYTKNSDWKALAKGPYGEELLHQIWLLYSREESAKTVDIMSSFSSLQACRYPLNYLEEKTNHSKENENQFSDNDENIARQIFGYIGMSLYRSTERQSSHLINNLKEVEKNLYHENSSVWVAACWAWALTHLHNIAHLNPAPIETLSRVFNLFIKTEDDFSRKWPALAIYSQVYRERGSWKIELSADEIKIIKKRANITKRNSKARLSSYEIMACYVIAFHSKSVWSELTLAKKLGEFFHQLPLVDNAENPIEKMLLQMGATGKKFAEQAKNKAKKIK